MEEYFWQKYRKFCFVLDLFADHRSSFILALMFLSYNANRQKRKVIKNKKVWNSKYVFSIICNL